MQDSIWNRFVNRLFREEIRRQVRAGLAAETDASFLVGASSAGGGDRDRLTPNRQETFEQALEAWRVNPLARRLVELTTQYVVGGGISIQCKHAPTAAFLEAFWNHPLNRMPVRVFEWCDELSRSGNLFVLLSTDAAGMSYLRAVPAGDIAEIQARTNDIEQPVGFVPRASLEQLQPEPWAAYNPREDAPGADGSFAPVMLHYAVNRPVGAQWGEPDLAPLLRWLSRYANWLEDRARLNRFRTAFLYVVKSRFSSESDRLARQQRLNANPPTPGSILVTDENETWEVISPRLESDEANTDGLALKKMVAAGAGVPLHFLAEPESSTRTTAEAAGGPTYRRFEQRQSFFLWLVRDVLQAALNRRALVDRRIDPRARVEVQGADLSARDNVALAMSANHIMAVLTDLRDRGLIDDNELLRVVYRFFGEVPDVAVLLEHGRKAGPRPPAKKSGIKIPPGKVDLVTGEPK
jgi:hypothetical protein